MRQLTILALLLMLSPIYSFAQDPEPSPSPPPEPINDQGIPVFSDNPDANKEELKKKLEKDFDFSPDKPKINLDFIFAAGRIQGNLYNLFAPPELKDTPISSNGLAVMFQLNSKRSYLIAQSQFALGEPKGQNHTFEANKDFFLVGPVGIGFGLRYYFLQQTDRYLEVELPAASMDITHSSHSVFGGMSVGIGEYNRYSGRFIFLLGANYTGYHQKIKANEWTSTRQKLTDGVYDPLYSFIIEGNASPLKDLVLGASVSKIWSGDQISYSLIPNSYIVIEGSAGYNLPVGIGLMLKGSKASQRNSIVFLNSNLSALISIKF